MSSRHHHRSPVLMEHAISPPHLLSPELNPSTTTIVQPATSDSIGHPTAEIHEGVELNLGSTIQAMDEHTESEASPTAASVLEESAITEIVMSAPAQAEHVSNESGVEGQNTAASHESSTEQTSVGDSRTTPEISDTQLVPETMSNGTDIEVPTASTTDQINDEAIASLDNDSSPAVPPAPRDVNTEGETAAGAEAEGEGVADEDTESNDNIPPWVQFEEDLSTPDEEEMKDIMESDVDRLDASDIRAMESHLFTDLDDTEQRPCKKMRLNWVIRGVRGTRERPNMAKVMNSPAVCVDGLYWSIKFYPRGDNCASLSAFVRCSRAPPKQLEEMPEHEFSFFKGPPEADFGNDYQPIVRVSAPNTLKERSTSKPPKKSASASTEAKQSENNANADSASERPWTPSHDDDDINDGSDDRESSDMKDWRVSAQLGMAIYNPAEPKTNQCQSDGHQYTKHCDDWGWVNFVGPWDKIHKRKRGDRRPLLQNDNLAIDAYIRLFDDPTEALWWHESKDELQWPSKELSGYYPMGTPALFHAPAVAGITAWALLAPFRKIIQAYDSYQWRTNSAVMPTPLISQTQLVLQLMRNLVGDCYVNVAKIIEELTQVAEHWEDVKTFWEVYRRGLELELDGDASALRAFSDIFDADGQPFPMPSIPVPGPKDIASGLSDHFTGLDFRGPLPNFMPVMLNRQHFDKAKREWKLHHDRIQLTDELNLSRWCTDSDSDYVLYGFVVHVGARNSGKFYSILRPGGVGTKWLAFEDGNGNKVFSYTKRKIQEFEGLEGDELEKLDGEREKAYMAMYIRKSCWNDYLPREIENYNLPSWLRPWIDGRVDIGDELVKEELEKKQTLEQSQKDNGVHVELYLDEFVEGRKDMLELHDLRSAPEAHACKQIVMVAMDKTFADLRNKIAEAFAIDDAKNVMLWEISYRDVGRYSHAELETVGFRKKIWKQTQPGEVYRVWVAVLPHDGRKESYKDLLPKIATMNLEVMAPKPEPILIPAEDAEAVDESQNPTSPQPMSMTEQPIDDSNQLPPDTSSSHTEDSTTTGMATPATGDTTNSAVDDEQESIAAAVAVDVDRASSATVDAGAGFSTDQDQTQAVRSGEEIIGEASGSDSTTPVPAEMNGEVLNSPLPDHPLEHNHLVEAMMSPALPSHDIPTAVDESMDTHGPTPDEEISAEDAAAIAALLAADAAESAAEMATPDENNDILAVPNGTEQDAGRPRSPAPVGEVTGDRAQSSQPRHVYGFLRLFDVEGQSFVAQAPFDPVLEDEIGPSVSKALGYSEDREIRIWKREGPSGTSPIAGSSTFHAEKLQDGFALIVGDVLSEHKVDALKQHGKFSQPAQLIKHLIMTRRRHPILSLTSETPVEIAEFGSDYFKGPVVNGQPHGENCLLITATGHTYEGPLIAGLKSGVNGKMTYQNGDVYKGEWLNDERHGQGEHIEARTGNRYVGGFENGKRWGEGTTYWKVADEQAGMCQICYGEEIDALFFDCGHVCACMECAERQRDNGCPICRKLVRQVVKMYRA